jgi:hypothetical protein
MVAFSGRRCQRRHPRTNQTDFWRLVYVHALCQTLPAATGFTNKNLRVLTAGLLGSTYTPGQMTYDLACRNKRDFRGQPARAGVPAVPALSNSLSR